MMDERLKYVTYCGLYCELCSTRGRVPKQAASLSKTMVKDGWDIWGKDLPNFKQFWEFLTRISDKNNACPGCRQGGGPPFCGIRKCAKNKGVDLCVDCEAFPCHRIKGLAKGYINLIPDMKRMKELGFDAWFEEQKERAATGFVYSDIRCPGYEVPAD
ncbi:MAG: DUF3795 domain-containing protein [Planctomycetota bacterium]